jgi:hypothetical protein
VALGLVALAIGGLAGLGMFGVAPLVPLGDLWSRFLGLAALPVALGLAAAGIGLLHRRNDDPWSLPWGRALAVEVALAAGLALLAGAFGPRGTGESGPGGLAGWALATTMREALGALPAALLWFGVGTVAVLAAAGLGRPELKAGLARLSAHLAAARSKDRAPRQPAPPDRARPAPPAQEPLEPAAGERRPEPALPKGRTWRRPSSRSTGSDRWPGSRGPS